MFTFSLNIDGSATYINGQNGTLFSVGSPGSTANPSSFDKLSVNAPFSVVGIDHSSVLSSFAYTSPATQKRVVRIFYRTSTGNIQNLYYSEANPTGGLTPDPAVIAFGVPAGSTFAASASVLSNKVSLFNRMESATN